MSHDTKAESAAIRRILNEDWDPIGGVPADEYDSYLWPVYALLMRGAPRSEVEGYLRWAADENITLPVPEDRLARVVDKLMGLGLARNSAAR